MNKYLRLASSILESVDSGYQDIEDEIKELAIYCISKSLTKEQIFVLQGIALASPCKSPSGKDGCVMGELVRVGLIHKTTLAGNSGYFAVNENGLNVISFLENEKGA